MIKKLILGLAFVTCSTALWTQIPVEVMAGDQKASFDLMFFKFFGNSKFLFFSRERAVVDYQNDAPQFGFTNAVSYNHPAWRGFAPVVVGQILNPGAVAKSGVQYARISPQVTLFGWAVADLKRRPNVDVFLLVRYTPALGKRLQGYSQLELLQVLPSSRAAPFAFTQRLRLGLKIKTWQFGLAADHTAAGRGQFTYIRNTGVFLRHEF